MYTLRGSRTATARSPRPSAPFPTWRCHRGTSGIVTDLLVDTDVLVDHLRGARRFDPGNATVHVSVVTRAELYAGQSAQESRIDILLGSFQEHSVDRAVAQTAGRLRRTVDIRLPDALIAATALEHELGLLTRNRRDFQRVEGLRLVALGPGTS
jgi:predicted nucleic acid-binding protein